MRPDETFYIITRYDENGKVIWERLSRKKQGYYSTVGSINSGLNYHGSPNDSVTLEEVNVTGRSIARIARFVNGVEEVTP